MPREYLAGLVLVTQLPGYDAPVALLANNGQYDYGCLKTNMRQNYRDITCYGVLKQGENPLTGLLMRIIPDRLGKDFGDLLRRYPNDFKPLTQFDDSGFALWTFGFLVRDASWIDTIRLRASTGGFHPVDPEDRIDVPNDLMRRSGATLMDPHQKEAVKKAFEIFLPELRVS